jgi:hypothetical protein
LPGDLLQLLVEAPLAVVCFEVAGDLSKLMICRLPTMPLYGLLDPILIIKDSGTSSGQGPPLIATEWLRW